jgi:hypothetical protein
VGSVTAAPLVVAVCTHRVSGVAARWERNIAVLEQGEFLVLIDAPYDAAAREFERQIHARGGHFLCHGVNRGLSAGRNTVLDAFPEHSILFIDDDVELNAAAVDSIRAAFAGGAQIVGARLIPPEGQGPWPWFFTPGQLHLVAWHSPGRPIKTWGACMGIDSGFAHRHGLTFDPRLSRAGRQLVSGDDTTFVAAMKEAGAVERLLPDVAVVHDADRGRFTLRYLLRRAYWQGRTEVRRNQAWRGLKKEWSRYRTGPLFLALVYVVACAIGVAHEAMSSGYRKVVSAGVPVTVERFRR